MLGCCRSKASPSARKPPARARLADVLAAAGRVQAARLEKLAAEFLVAHAERLGLGADHALDALALRDARKDAVGPDLVGPGLDREALGEPDHAPLRRR